MGNLISAEFRKILTTNLWWALMIPTVAVAFFWSLGWSISGIDLDAFRLGTSQLPWSAAALARGFNIAAVFPMVFGGLAFTQEIGNRTITTTFLTGAPRSSVLWAKTITYLVWGLVYGVAIGLMVSLGTAVGSDTGHLPDGSTWLLIVLAGVLMCMLWTLLGLGVGALIGSGIGTLVVLLVYALLVGPLSELILFGVTEGSKLSGFLPNGSANGMTSSTAAEAVLDQLRPILAERGGILEDKAVEDLVWISAGAPGGLTQWVSGLVFLGWTALLFGLGMLRNQRRDIT
ncbi:ABC transporter permease [Actinokineospora sp. NBRC 105648]|uniref:ABC transporter permease n=1 Tax=Actinokineospora sp. NBRC 105648 TaxID=3032206 RepID=UPI0024A312AF|nr:ABC transporter permease [Actinokineospora sp. NBRC 105648]GLZ42390.1 ABC transporter permease [Actinokineospora sp. NBRC 105648]